MLPTIETIIQGAVNTVAALPGVGIVDERKNGASTWSRSPGVKQSYWIVDHERSEAKATGVGGTSPGRGLSTRTRKVVIDAWMPWGVDIETAVAFRDILNDVEWQLTQNRGLGVCAKMDGMPVVEFNRVEPYTSNNQNDESRPCHHARIAFNVVAFVPVSGS